jgi:hypothetical protein
MEIKVHTEKFEKNHHWASCNPHRVISFKVGERRLFFHHGIAVDNRGSHYGETCEGLSLIKNPREYKRLRKQFVRKEEFDDLVVKALEKSNTKSLSRFYMSYEENGSERWCERFLFRSQPLDY